MITSSATLLQHKLTRSTEWDEDSTVLIKTFLGCFKTNTNTTLLRFSFVLDIHGCFKTLLGPTVSNGVWYMFLRVQEWQYSNGRLVKRGRHIGLILKNEMGERSLKERDIQCPVEWEERTHENGFLKCVSLIKNPGFGLGLSPRQKWQHVHMTWVQLHSVAGPGVSILLTYWLNRLLNGLFVLTFTWLVN